MELTSPRLAWLAEQITNGVPEALDDFWRATTKAGTPFVEPAADGRTLVTFVWRGEAKSVGTGWGVRVSLHRLPGTDLWHATVPLPSDLHTLYYLRRNDVPGLPATSGGHGSVHIDPANPCRLRFPADPDDPTDRPVWASVLRLPDAPPDLWSTPRPNVPRGRLLRHSLRSRALGGRRRVWVYRPAGRAHHTARIRGLPALVVLDGYLARTVLRQPTTLDNLIAAGRIPPLVAIFVATANGARRLRELAPGSRMCRFLTHELVPWAQRRFEVTADPQRRVVAGASVAGLAAAYAGRFAPGTFGAVIAQSGSFWWPPPTGRPEWLTRQYADGPALPLRFYLDVGALEEDAVSEGHPTQVAAVRRLRDTLMARGYPVTYAEYTGHHDYVNWRRTFADALVAVLGGDPS